jgi:hypothetical protein
VTNNPMVRLALAGAVAVVVAGCASKSRSAAAKPPAAPATASAAAAAPPATGPRFDASRSDPKAVAIADQVMSALGGADAWNRTRYLRFDFVPERDGKPGPGRAHTWDKQTGRYRVEWTGQDGKRTVVLMNLNTKEGSAWVDGQKLEGEDAKKALDRAYGAWTNDTYWLLMPYKLEDPGVILAYDGQATTPSGTYDKIVLTFDNVGLTPKDKYWVFVNPKTHLVDHWEFVLKGEQVPPTPFDWKGWTRKGAIMLAPERASSTEPGRKIMFPVLEAPASVPDSVFTSPAPAS